MLVSVKQQPLSPPLLKHNKRYRFFLTSDDGKDLIDITANSFVTTFLIDKDWTDRKPHALDDGYDVLITWVGDYHVANNGHGSWGASARVWLQQNFYSRRIRVVVALHVDESWGTFYDPLYSQPYAKKLLEGLRYQQCFDFYVALSNFPKRNEDVELWIGTNKELKLQVEGAQARLETARVELKSAEDEANKVNRGLTTEACKNMPEFWLP